MEQQNKKHSLLLATKLIEELPDASNGEEYDQ